MRDHPDTQQRHRVVIHYPVLENRLQKLARRPGRCTCGNAWPCKDRREEDQ